MSKIKIINSIKTNELTPTGNYKVQPTNLIQSNSSFKLGQLVKYKSEDIIGKIDYIDDTKLIVLWHDNTKERIKLAEAVNELEYVDSIQTLVAPMTPQVSKEPANTEADAITDENINKALAALDLNEQNDNDNDIEVINAEPPVTANIDIEKLKLQRKVGELEHKFTTKVTNNLKEKIAKELIDVMVLKDMIDKDDVDVELQKILTMNDAEFEDYKNQVVAYQKDGNEVTSTVEETAPLTEGELALRRIRSGQSSDVKIANESTINDSDRRSLNQVRDNKITFNNQYVIPNFEDQFTDILSSKVNEANEQPVRNQVKVAEQTKTLPGFENLHGLTRPLVPTKPAKQFPVNSQMSELFSDFDWTIVSKKY
jgi:hypothetical protein